MSHRKDQSNPLSGPNPGEANPRDPRDDRNAFASFFLDHMARREPAPATPEAAFAGPWRVVRLHGGGPRPWACMAAGERRPRVKCQDPDVAYLVAAGLAITEQPVRFHLQKDADGRMHLLFDGFPVATTAWPIAPGCNLPEDLSRLADLRMQPQALASFLLSVPDEVLRRTGVILAEEVDP